MKTLLTVFAVLLFGFSQAQSIYSSKETFVTFFSKAELEDIKAENKATTSLIKVAAKEIVVRVPINGFSFEQSLMQEHFNEKKYMWTEKYPHATFEGKIESDFDFTKDGTYPVKAVGDLTVRGVTHKRTIEGTFTVKGDEVKLKAEFHIPLDDHKIERPALVLDNIAEKVLVTLDATYKAYVPKK